MHYTTLDEAAANLAANEELFNDLMRVEEMLEDIQNLNSPANMPLLSPTR